MPNLNDVKVMGHLCRDAELRYTNSGKEVTNFTVAVNRDFGDDTDFIKVTCWNRGNYKLAEYCGTYEKGDLVFVDGEIRQDNWEDSEGNNRQSIFINADKVVNFSQGKGGSTNEPDDEFDGDDFDDDEFDTPF